MQEYSCPNCNFKISIGKEKLVKCYRCESELLLATINGNKVLYDVTPGRNIKDERD